MRWNGSLWRGYTVFFFTWPVSMGWRLKQALIGKRMGGGWQQRQRVWGPIGQEWTTGM